jgi:bifunctional DNA-binding transcriptional regulator/antitoxin component of YhaV-PrlF toxin-antitoxin module
MNTEKQTPFLALLQAENRIQIPIEIRQYLKLETGNYLKLRIQSTNNWSSYENCICRLASDGRITVPWEVRVKLGLKPGEMMRVYIFTEA